MAAGDVARPLLDPDVVIVPAGNALLGDPPRTEHVNVFAVARRPVTNEEYARFRPEHTPRGAAPVRGVSWADAVGYCRWLTTSTGHIYRLPDEREWEKAARAGVLEETGALEWTNSWAPARPEGARPRGRGQGPPRTSGAEGPSEPGGRVLRGRDDVAKRRYVGGDLREAGFRVVRGMTGR